MKTTQTKPSGSLHPVQPYPWEDAYEALLKCIEEDAKAIEKLVADEDSYCPARELRRERAATLRYVLALADTLKRWDWG
jgi:hypothetical protein